MIKLLFKLPRDITVAFSGGVDSTAIVDFLSKNHNVRCAFFHHGTDNSERAFEFVTEFCNQRNLPFTVGYLTKEKPKSLSAEEHWRNERYSFFDNLDTDIVTAHNLDDCVETYLWSALHGQAKLIPTRRNKVLRPFLTTPKTEFVSWCLRKDVAWCEDLSNKDTKYTRNYIRHELMPHALHVNPGLYTVIKKLVQKQQLPL